jgi:hypothetical protein
VNRPAGEIQALGEVLMIIGGRTFQIGLPKSTMS